MWKEYIIENPGSWELGGLKLAARKIGDALEFSWDLSAHDPTAENPYPVMGGFYQSNPKSRKEKLAAV